MAIVMEGVMVGFKHIKKSSPWNELREIHLKKRHNSTAATTG
jgi:hypothetical protein